MPKRKKKGTLREPDTSSVSVPSTDAHSLEPDKSLTDPRQAEVIPIKYNFITRGLPKKQAPGKLGRPVQLICNLFPINLLPDGKVYHYDVQIIDKKRSGDSELSMLAPDKDVQRYRCLSTKINRKVIDRMLKENENFARTYAVYDGQNNLYAPRPLELKFPYKTEVVVEDRPQNKEEAEKEDKFRVIIKEVNKKDGSCAISFDPLHELFSGRKHNVDDIQEAVMALETVFRHSPALRYTPIGRNFFHPSLGNMHPLSGGVEIWFGYHQSSRLTSSKLMINLDTSATTFFSRGPLLNYFASALGKSEASFSSLTEIEGKDIKRISKELKNLKVGVTHQTTGRKYVIVAVTKNKANELKLDDNEEKTIAEFFLEKYGIRLKYPHLPCVQVKPEKRKSYIPLELCKIVEEQHCKRELTAKEKSEMIKYTADPPKDKFQKINNIRQKYANYERDEYLRQFGIRVQLEPTKVPGRELEAPNLVYENKKFQPREGSWNLRDLRFYIGAQVESWCLLNFSLPDRNPNRFCNQDDLKKFSSMLQRIGSAAGLKLNNSPNIQSIKLGPNKDQNWVRISQELKNIASRKVSLVVVVIPDKNKDVYTMVKQIAETKTEHGLITQCIDHNNVIKCNPSLASNLCQKINAKMGGTNHTLTPGEIPKVMAKPTIVMGADVSHASVTEVEGLSVAAIVGSLNVTMTRFACVCKLQKNEDEKKKSIELIVELKDMVKDLLKAFHFHTRGKKPENIIFYRDGVSDGHFSEVKEKEVTAIRLACRELQNDYQPNITFAVIQKRHHVRLKFADDRDGSRRNDPSRNIRPGTVIDTDIVHTVHRDFFLNSQVGLKGTNVPCHYTILEDDSNFEADDFQKLTYYLCNLFVRCTKSISQPVPVRYAHLAAYRMRVLLPKPDGRPDKKEKRDAKEVLAEITKAIQLPKSIQQAMFYV